MQFTVELEILNGLSTIGLECGAEIVQWNSRKVCHHPVRDSARQPARQPPVLSLRSPAADDVVALLELGDEGRNFFGVVLQVAVHGDDDLASRGVETRLERRCLAKVAA